MGGSVGVRWFRRAETGTRKRVEFWWGGIGDLLGVRSAWKAEVPDRLGEAGYLNTSIELEDAFAVAVEVGDDCGEQEEEDADEPGEGFGGAGGDVGEGDGPGV